MIASVSARFFTREVFKTAGEFEACHPIMIASISAPFFTREVFKTAGEFGACHPLMMRRSPRSVKLSGGREEQR
jgi:hypothetical protein